MNILPSSFNVVTLGDFTFTNMEVPSQIPLGGTHALAVHNLVGGGRIVDALGPVAAPLEWSGYFMGANALARARYLDNLRVKGKPLFLRWSTLNYTVIIEKFSYTYENQFRIPYSISCVVVKDNTQPVTQLVQQMDWGEAIKQAVDDADESVAAVVETSAVPKSTLDFLKSEWEKLKALIRTINNVSKAIIKIADKIKSSIRSIRNTIKSLKASLSNFLKTVKTLGGLLPNHPKNASDLRNIRSNTSNFNHLCKADNHLANMDKNVTQLTSASARSTTSTTTSRGVTLPAKKAVHRANLYALAATYYGDAMKWNLIAAANNLTIPYVDTPMTLIIPQEGT